MPSTALVPRVPLPGAHGRALSSPHWQPGYSSVLLSLPDASVQPPCPSLPSAPGIPLLAEDGGSGAASVASGLRCGLLCLPRMAPFLGDGTSVCWPQMGD